MATITNTKLKHYKMVEQAYKKMLNTSYFIEEERKKVKLHMQLFRARTAFFVILTYAIYITYLFFQAYA